MKYFARRTALTFFLALSAMNIALAQSVKSPSEFLGYKLGDQFTPEYRVVEYFSYVASVSKNVRIQPYGKTTEGRELLVAYVASDENIARLDALRNNNLKLAGIQDGVPDQNQPAIVWLSYNVHGSEAVSTEAAMQTLFALVDPANAKTKAWLKNTVVVIDPCLNPDGRDRYVNFYNPIKNAVPDINPYAREHMEPWPGGRSNHYYFDLNRDWAWQTQVETQQRMALYNQWLPQIHVDFHEQGYNDPYYFAPAAEPIHQDISKWQRDFQVEIGRNNAKYFDQNAWMYYTRERYDLVYPSYGDTYPLYNGSIGMTYEQGGGGRAGLAILNSTGDTLSLRDRIDHHYTTGLSTIEMASNNASKLISEFRSYFAAGKASPPGEYKSYVIKGGNYEKLKSLADLLKRNGIQFGYGASKGATGFNYATLKTEAFQIGKGDIVISAYQPKSVLLKVLFEPKTYVSDSITYDITAWALPYAYGLDAYASREALKPLSSIFEVPAVSDPQISNPVAFIANWNSLADVKFLSALLKNGIKVRYTERAIEEGGNKFNAGSLIIARTSNEQVSRFSETVSRIAKESGVNVQAVATGFVDKGTDLGSNKIRYIEKPSVAVVGGDESSSLALGEIWHFFEQQINYPVTIIRYRDLARANLNSFDVLVVPDGSYPDLASDKLMAWIRSGGRLVAMGGALEALAGKKGFGLKTKDAPKPDEAKEPYDLIKPYGNRERESARDEIPGAIYRVDLDNTHPLAFGFPNYYFTVKQDNSIYKFLESGWNIGVFKKNNLVSGQVGAEVKKRLADGLLLGTEDIDNGSVVYLTEDLLFRGFWENGKLMFSNAVFMVGQ
jgi:hypothetical protein